MIGIVIVTHGGLAGEFRAALEHVGKALSDDGFRTDPGKLEEKLVSLTDGVILA